MSDPQRLLDGDATKDELELLGSWKHEEPSPGARNAVLGLLAASATSAAAASAATGMSGVLKAILTGTLCVLATLGVVGMVGSLRSAPREPSPLAIVAPGPALPPDESPPSANEAPQANATAAVLEPIEPPTRAALPPPAPNDDPTNEPGTTPGDPVAVARATAAPAPRSDLAAEIASIDAARTALASGNARQTLARLDAHDAAFRRGALAQEAMLLRVEALARLGRRREAAALGRAFLRVHPTSTLAARVRAAVPELRGEAESPH